MKNKNEPKIKGGIIDLNRAQIEHRAGWLALMYDEAEKAGADAESIARKAVKRMGGFHGHLFKSSMKNPENLEEFRKSIFNGISEKTFEMDNIQTSEDELTVEFHYCPLLTAWRKLGFSEERNAKLCDITMDGDRGIAEELGFELELTDTIASGCGTCKLRFKK